jgi:peptidoglycan/xylan/chitin deacetylase (PgdA/CDA1 family)
MKGSKTTYGKRGLFIRLAYLLVAIAFFFTSKIGRTKQKKKIVICYHGVKDIQKLRFYKQMVMIGRFVASKDLPSKSVHKNTHHTVCVTFDDAFANLLSNVIPTIAYLNIPITIFIPTGSIGEIPKWLRGSEHPDSYEMVMSTTQILALKDESLVCFGSHTVDHLCLSKLGETDMRRQLRTSRENIARIIGKKITELALPHGCYNDVVVRLALEEGYENIYTLEPVLYDDDRTVSRHLIGRFSVSPDDWSAEFYLTINGAYVWLAQWRSFLNKIRK